MTLPVRRGTSGRLSERRFPGWRDPLAEFDDLFGRMGSLLESTVGGALTEGAAWAPLADFAETDDAYQIDVDVPGVKRDDISIEVTDREMVISGEFKERERGGVLRRGTRRTGRFEYRTMLPGEINAEGINATLSDGVLTVTVPKAEAARPRRIEITAGE
ncbi:heat-shock protein Hsp20 [Streptomyces sp. SA15]|uniref:Hsp20/alpha crystallin family protein n=1 Tax=Streptomyces sp. SA15 TaxID=934019 RepID=UPI000BB086C8|nr:Hsp20/alpha crystallin family protein [Streptomyces sp. SA15]PAZ17325.1 heat-shock protein Hsp20 [Streptomyces sp. SA15]